jgi:hypothetical protein
MANGENHSVLRYFGNLSDPRRDNEAPRRRAGGVSCATYNAIL